MTHHQLGHTADAKMWLERGDQEASDELQSLSDPQNWTQRLFIRLLQKEATELIRGKTRAREPSSPREKKRNQPSRPADASELRTNKSGNAAGPIAEFPGKSDDEMRLAARENPESRSLAYDAQALAALKERAESLKTARSFPEAEAAWREVHAAYESQLGADHWETRMALQRISGVLTAQSKFAEAEAISRQAMVADEKWRPDQWNTFNLKSGLGEFPLREARKLIGQDPAAAQEKFAEAESLMLAGYEGMKARADRMNATARQQYLSAAIRRLTELYNAWEKPKEAARWRAELEAMEKESQK